MRYLPVILVALCFASSSAAQEDATPLWPALRAGGHVALIRHAGTVGGSGDPPGFKLDDRSTQRNLTLKGRAEARRLGEMFRVQEVPVARVLSSQWCRCIETVALMGLGPPELAPTFNNAFTYRDRVEELTAGGGAIIADWNGPGTLVVMTHGANILQLTGIMPEEGGVVVVKADPDSPKKLRVLGRIMIQP
jgi:phosphohistidine phosphatase SixA